VLSANPFAELSAYVPPLVMQMYVLAMIFLVVAGTVFDVIHKKSAEYFFNNWRDSKTRGSRRIGAIETGALALRTMCVEVATSAEFCSARRRVAHLLTMYGFIAYVVATAVMVLAYPTPAIPTPGIWSFLWYAGALSVCAGGYWFWFAMRVDVAAEGNSPYRVMRADLFILTLLASVTMGLLWALFQGSGFGWLCFGLYVIATTMLFGSVPWSKFAHMFFKPAAAFQKRVAEADGSRSNLPGPADKPETLGSVQRLPQNY